MRLRVSGAAKHCSTAAALKFHRFDVVETWVVSSLINLTRHSGHRESCCEYTPLCPPSITRDPVLVAAGGC